MTDDEGVVALFFGFYSVAYDVLGDSEFRYGVQVAVGERDAMNLERDFRVGYRGQVILQALDVGTLFYWIDEALVPATRRVVDVSVIPVHSTLPLNG